VGDCGSGCAGDLFICRRAARDVVAAAGDRAGGGGGVFGDAGDGGAVDAFAGWVWDASGDGAAAVCVFGADGVAVSELRDDDELGVVCEGEYCG